MDQNEIQTEINTPELPPHKNWLSRHMIVGYLFLGLVLAGAIWAGYEMKFGGIKNQESRIENQDDQVCIQVIQKARNPQTGETKEFPTPCDVPEGWETVSESDVVEQPFVFIGKRPTGSNADLYEGRIIVEGTYEEYYPETLGGGILFFKINENYKSKMPIKYESPSSTFAFDNDFEAKSQLKIDESVFVDKKVCQLSGSAKIVIEGYTVELLESAVWDHTKLVDVISRTEQSIHTCEELNVAERQ